MVPEGIWRLWIRFNVMMKEWKRLYVFCVYFFYTSIEMIPPFR